MRKLHRNGLELLVAMIVLRGAASAADAGTTPGVSAGALEKIVVTASRHPAGKEFGRATTVLDLKRIETTPASSPQELVDGLSSLHLRRGDSRALGAVSQRITLRNVGEGRTLVLADGLPLNDPFGGWILWHKVPKSQIARVEVVRGAVSDLYGDLGIGGVVQLFTHPVEAQRNILEADFGQFDTSHLALTLSTRAPNGFGVKIFGDTLDSQGYLGVLKSQSGLVDLPTSFSSRNVGFRTDWKKSDAVSLFASSQYYQSDEVGNTSLISDRFRIFDAAAGLDLATDGGQRWQFRLHGGRETYSKKTSSVNSARTTDVPSVQQEIPVSYLGGSVVWSRAWGNNSFLTLGLDTRNIAFNMKEGLFNTAGNLLGTGSSEGQQLSSGLFVEWRTKLSERWILTAAARADSWHNFDGVGVSTANAVRSFETREETVLNPHLGLVFSPSEPWAVRAAAYTGFRAPNLSELYRDNTAANKVVRGEPALAPERVLGGELGCDWSPVPSTKVSVTGFYNHLRDMMSKRALSSNVEKIENFAAARSFGGEMEVRFSPIAKLELDFAYALSHTEVLEFPIKPEVQGRRLQDVPLHSGSVSARWLDPDLVNATIRVRAESESFSDDMNTPSRALHNVGVVDAMLSKSVRAMEFFVSVVNLLDAPIRTGSSVPNKVGAPRRIWGGVRWKLWGL